MKNVNNWFEYYLRWLHDVEKPQESNSNNNENLWTYTDLVNSLNKDFNLVTLDKLSINVNTNIPDNTAIFQITNIGFDNFIKHSSSLSAHGMEGPHNLFSIESIIFSTGNSGRGEIKNSKLSFIPHNRTFSFSINEIKVSAEKHELLQIPKMKMNKTLALKLDIGFDKDFLSRMLINVYPIKMYISTKDLIEQLNSISNFHRAFDYDKLFLVKYNLIPEAIFINVGDVSKLSKPRQTPKRFSPDKLKIGPFAAGLSTFLKLNLELIKITCAKEDTKFSKIAIINAEFEKDSKDAYTGNIEMVKLNPKKGCYKNLFLNISPNQALYIKIEKGESVPIVTIGNAKIIYLDSAIRDLTDFKKEIQAKLKNHAKELSNSRSPLPKEMESNHSIENNENTDQKMIKMHILNSIVVVPEDSDSKNIFEVYAEQVEVDVSNLRLFD